MAVVLCSIKPVGLKFETLVLKWQGQHLSAHCAFSNLAATHTPKLPNVSDYLMFCVLRFPHHSFQQSLFQNV